MFLFSSTFNIANYADCSPYELSGSINDVINKLENDSITLIKWYDCNYLIPNPEKWHLLLNVARNDLSVTVGNNCVRDASCEKNLGVYFDNTLNFDIHVTKLCKKAGEKLHALARVASFTSFNLKKLIFNAFISSQFNYCPLIWLCHIVHWYGYVILSTDMVMSYCPLIWLCHIVHWYGYVILSTDMVMSYCPLIWLCHIVHWYGYVIADLLTIALTEFTDVISVLYLTIIFLPLMN